LFFLVWDLFLGLGIGEGGLAFNMECGWRGFDGSASSWTSFTL